MKKISKIIIKVTGILLGILMLLITVGQFLPDIKILFTHESAIYLSNISDVNKLAAVIFLLFYIILLFKLLKEIKVNIAIFLCVILFGWLISGRTIAFKKFPDGRVITGFYYIEIDSFSLCKEDLNYEQIIKKTIIRRSIFWTLSVTNANIHKVIFIGPLTWGSSIKVFGDLLPRN